MDAYDTSRFEDFQNQNASDVPAFGIMRVTDSLVLSDGRLAYKTDQPNSFGDVGTCMVNASVNVAGADGTNFSFGKCSRTGIILALYDEGTGIPAYGQTWGPVNNSWKLVKGSGGFLCMGPATNGTMKIARFSAVPLMVARGQIDSDCSPGGSADLTVFASGVTTSQKIPGVINDSDCTIRAKPKFATALYDQIDQQWYFVVGRTA